MKTLHQQPLKQIYKLAPLTVKKLLVVVCCFFNSLKTMAQQPIIYPLDTFIAQIKKHHPIAKQADIQVDKASAELLSAKGSFDPTIALDASRKTFDGKNY